MNPKSLLLSLSVVALGAAALVAPSAASAEATMFHNELKGTIIEGEQLKRPGELLDEKKFNAGTITCESITFSGTMATETAETLTLSAVSKKCSMGTQTVEVLTNKCNYVFKSGEKDFKGNLEGHLDIECQNAGESIDYVAKVGGVTKCTIHALAQQGLTTVTHTNEAAEGEEQRHLHVDVGVTGINYKQTAGIGVGACTGFGEEVKKDGSWTGTELFRGIDGKGGHIALWVE